MNNLHLAQYEIPRVNVQMPGRQNRLADGKISIIPSMTHPFQFILGNTDGMPYNLAPFSASFIVWKTDTLTHTSLNMGQSDIILNKKIQIDDPYASGFEFVLTEEDTLVIGQHTGNVLCWSIILQNSEGQMFPLKVSMTHGNYGYLHVDVANSFPLAEIIRSGTR